MKCFTTPILFRVFSLGGTGSAAKVSDLFLQAFARVNQRNSVMQHADSYFLVLTKLDTGGNGFMKVDMDTGEVLQRIRLDDKTPSIYVDDVLAGMYYLKPNQKQFVFYSLLEN